MNLQFILVEPAVPENIGASARAIKTMGFDRLVLVNPCEWKEGKARWVAHGSQEILDNALVFNSLAEAIKDSDYNIATSARKRSISQDHVSVSDLRNFLYHKGKSITTVSVVFGREESGLTNDEVKLCDITSSVAIRKPFPSLNLSHAVMLYAYELSEIAVPGRDQNGIHETSSYQAAKAKVIKLLKALDLNENDSRFGRILERISFLGDGDIHLIHSISSLISEKIEHK